MKVFIDTSAFVALFYANDARHGEALQKNDALTAGRHQLLTSNAVLYETLNWIAVRLGPRPAAEFGLGVRRQTERLIVLPLSEEDEAGALRVLEKFSQIRLSFVDASSIHLFKRLGIDRLFGFDHHFSQANIPLF